MEDSLIEREKKFGILWKNFCFDFRRREYIPCELNELCGLPDKLAMMVSGLLLEIFLQILHPNPFNRNHSFKLTNLNYNIIFKWDISI